MPPHSTGVIACALFTDTEGVGLDAYPFFVFASITFIDLDVCHLLVSSPFPYIFSNVNFYIKVDIGLRYFIQSNQPFIWQCARISRKRLERKSSFMVI